MGSRFTPTVIKHSVTPVPRAIGSPYIAQAFDHLAECQATIEALRKRIKGGEKLKAA